MREVLLLGASGSIGTQTLDILREDRKSFSLKGFSVGKRIEVIPSILADFPEVSCVCVYKESDCYELSKKYPNIKWFFGDEGLKQLIMATRCQMVVNALVGFVGLVPTLAALDAGKILCLANKESLVVGGALVNESLKKHNGKLYPIDSEHVAIGKLLSQVDRDNVETIYITASGGAFRNLERAQLGLVTPEMALKHPTWQMGAKITIDCATMFNKGFEVLEAKWLYDFPIERTKILMHDESKVHSLLKLKDGTIIADVSDPDMHTPIKYALYETKVGFDAIRANNLADLGPFHFHEFLPDRYPAVGLVLESFIRAGTAPAVLNAANEEAVYAFLDGKLPFLKIEEVVRLALDAVEFTLHPTIEDIIKADADSRAFVKDYLGENK